MCNTVVPKIIFDRTTGAAHEGMQRIHKALHVRIQVHMYAYNTMHITYLRIYVYMYGYTKHRVTIIQLITYASTYM